MSSRNTFVYVVGIVSIIGYCAALVLAIVGTTIHGTKVNIADIDPDQEFYSELNPFTTDNGLKAKIILIASAVICTFMIIVSGLLMWGVKKERPRFIAPWIYIVLISLILRIVILFVDTNAKTSSRILNIVVCVFTAAIWYPIFRIYKGMVFNQKTTF